ncbi:MAG: GAF domain-containing protein [Anaerolineae bacterium]|nr:GAF domain-containing protein [Anaerolineae bacterium]
MMWAAIKRFFSPPVFEGDEDKTRSAQMLNTLLWLVLAGVLIFATSVAFTLQNEMEPLVILIAVVLGMVTVTLFILLRRGYVLPVGIILALTLWLGFTIPMFNFAGLHDTAITGYFFIITMVGVLAGWRSMLFFSGITAAAFITAYYGEQVGFLVPVLPLPSKIDDLILLLLMLGSTALMLWYAVQRISGAYERLRRSANALTISNQELEQARQTVENQAGELAQRTQYLETTAIIARESAALLDTPEVMLQRLSEIVADTYDYYLVSIFLIDDTGEWVELKAASNEDGQRLIERDYRLRVGSGWAGEGIVGNVADTGKMRVVRDVATDSVYVDTSELPGTVSEVAFPLLARGSVIGVIDIQSQRLELFSDSEIELLQGLVSQIALAVDNATLVDRLQASIDSKTLEYNAFWREAWSRTLKSGDKIMVSDNQGTGQSQIDWHPGMVKSALTGNVVVDSTQPSLYFPIKARDRIIGVIEAQLPVAEGSWTTEQVELMESITQQLGATLETAQLYIETQNQAARETLTREVSDKMRSALSWEELLQTALNEISGLMGTSRAFIQLLPPPETTSGNEQELKTESI